MKTIGLAAIIALTSTAAFAGSFQFSIGGGTARIDYDEDCTDRLCASVSWQEHGSRERTKFRLPEVSTKTISKYIDVPKPHWNSSPSDDDGNDEMTDTTEPSSEPSSKPSAREGRTAERDEPASMRQAEREPSAKGEAQAPAPRTTTRVAAPTPSADSAPAREPAPAPSANNSSQASESAPDASDPAPKSTKVANVAPAVEKTAKPSRSTPVGEWLVEDGEGKIRIEECGANMCGYVSEAKNPKEKDRHNPNPALRNRSVIGTPILINMKPNGKRWSGRIYNVKDGRSYTAHISLKSADTLRVEGCAFGGMICGGQNWSRIN